MKKQIKSLLCGLCAAALALGCAGCGGSVGPEVPAKVTDITVWTYYNGDQLESFTSLVNQFNETVGAQKGIKVSTESQGSVNDLETSVMDSALRSRWARAICLSPGRPTICRRSLPAA